MRRAWGSQSWKTHEQINLQSPPLYWKKQIDPMKSQNLYPTDTTMLLKETVLHKPLYLHI